MVTMGSRLPVRTYPLRAADEAPKKRSKPLIEPATRRFRRTHAPHPQDGLTQPTCHLNLLQTPSWTCPRPRPAPHTLPIGAVKQSCRQALRNSSERRRVQSPSTRSTVSGAARCARTRNGPTLTSRTEVREAVPEVGLDVRCASPGPWSVSCPSNRSTVRSFMVANVTPKGATVSTVPAEARAARRFDRPGQGIANSWGRRSRISLHRRQ
jgi:hypothetical protein